MFPHGTVIDVKIFGKTGGDCGHHALPVHQCPPVTLLCCTSNCLARAAKVSRRAGKTGGRTESGFHLKRNCVVGPQTRPCQAPIPQRVCSLADRHDVCCRRREYETSSQRQTIVSGRGRLLNSARRRNVLSSNCAKRLAFLRLPNHALASVVRPAAAKPAIWPSMSANSTPPMLVGSPAQKTDEMVVS